KKSKSAAIRRRNNSEQKRTEEIPTMKALKLVVCLLGLSCAMLSQSGTPSAGTESDQDKISEKIKLLQDAMDQQQKQIQALQEELAQQKKARADAQVVNASYNVPNANNPAAAVQKDGDK